MNAKEARQLTIQSADHPKLVKYVEDDISNQVLRLAKEGLFNGEVYVSIPYWYAENRKFGEKAINCLEELGYEVLACYCYVGGFSYDISWENAR